ncbi:MAG TPA: bifunctional proline dehydrogenase/L-glutamate gamma-semialdehyde dehydrogenase PutA [Povalibacter sp.]|uniref:bifunctional proline dehydrogenase/L-glutamate gamma-semialdehyde dehydrogenase PutA n=1 Tax=Povalibacter sp. TaxID=1962978 RepID=UPI002B6A0139|nr:bifunctional proline dehydrogenase/L-glutamate gamma-semialdehyde dehydrogenase PutA [Povalibacter sp.]HMN43377.1 bifunctional proline dehydrogenase/L-glutamate gamma-semialdehyde dehydrogenase PutA [Povalibacter sp.]
MSAERSVAQQINRLYLGDEERIVTALAERARLTLEQRQHIADQARRLVDGVRENQKERSGLDAFLQQYDLSSQEGVILMCLAEALLRIPDDATADRLIADKITRGDWGSHFGQAESLFVNASTWGLMLTGRIVRPADEDLHDPRGFVARVAGRLGEPVLRAAFRQAMRIMGHQFVMGRTIGEALERSRSKEHRLYRHSFDMLGESALTTPDAIRYLAAYHAAIREVAASVASGTSIEAAPSISVKLSALFPRYEFTQRRRVHQELAPRLLELAVAARDGGIALTVDAEEAERLELSLELIEHVARAPQLAGWQGFGLAVQAYQKRALDVIGFLAALARATQRRLNVRLVKGAYWDSEIKRSQERGLSGYPVFTRKVNTDVSYVACAREMIAAGEDVIYPQFATHNAQTVATILELADGAGRGFEFQRLHGMGEDLYAQVVGPAGLNKPCRIYAPVGSHEELLPYLVRRLLENGANTSFVNRIVDEDTAVEEIIRDPVAVVDALERKAHPRIPLPRNLYGEERLNSRGVNLPDPAELDALLAGIHRAGSQPWRANPIVSGKAVTAQAQSVTNPANRSEVIGTVSVASEAVVDAAVTAAVAAQPEWNDTEAGERAGILLQAADLYEAHLPELVAYCIREGGRSIPDSISEVREAVDFLRYYASRAVADFGAGLSLPGPTGESNELRLQGRGVFVCISPWNFPLAIFTGQIAAALAAGNAVIAKPAEQTPLIATRAVELLLEAGVPPGVLHLLTGDGASVGARAVADPRIAGVAFTGSTETAQAINRSLAARSGPIPVLIAETGGQNALIADSSALPEQIVLDVVQSGFNSAGQRCSALRALFVQEEIAPRVLQLLAGYMDELKIGDPADIATDVGPVIDQPSCDVLAAHAARITKGASWQHTRPLTPDLHRGSFFAPLAVEIGSLSQLTREVFGPIVHVIRYRADDLDKVIDAINATGYGLTLGIHTRVDASARYIASRVRSGNVYVNRNMIGAVVGVQPFGGRGLSGTGPKAGGPYYLHRFATEQTITINTAAIGGNASLLTIAAE